MNSGVPLMRRADGDKRRKSGLLVALGLLGLLAGQAAAETVRDLYRGETIVTGQDNLPERERGFREALKQVVVKVSGDARLIEQERFERMLEQAADYVARFDYEDRKKGIQISDEQGTRDRSYHLRVDFVPERIDRAVAELGGKPWSAGRPKLLVLLGIRDTVSAYVLGMETARGYGQRETFLLLERRRGIPLVLPRMDAAESRSIGYDDVASAKDGSAFQDLKEKYGADAVLLGTMDVTPAGYWDTRWTLLNAGQAASWRSDGLTFDRAIADGLGRSARLMAGSD